MKLSIRSNMIYFVLFILICCLLTASGFSQQFPSVIGLITVIFITFFVFSYSSKEVRSKNDILILAVSFVAKLSYLLYRMLYSYGTSITDPSLSADARRFWNHAILLYQGNAVSTDTRFPYVLNAEFHVFGPNILCVLLFNIFLTMVMAFFVIKLLNRYAVIGKYKIISLAVCSLLPYEIIVSCSLLRESVYFVFIILSFYYFQEYVAKSNYKYLLFALFIIIPVFLLHPGYFPIVIVYFIDSFRHDRPKTSNQLLMRILLIISLFGLLILGIRMDSTGGGYVSRGVSGLINKVTGEQGSGFSDEAGSRYLEGLTINSIPTLIIYAPIRALYFLFSPLPTNWRGISDVFAFIVDGCVHFYVIYSALKARKKLKRLICDSKDIVFYQYYRLINVGLYIILAVAFVFCLNTNNAGTAIRHRDVLIGIEAVMMGLSLKIRSDVHRA